MTNEKHRKNFVEAIATKSTKEKTLTENGAIAYDSSGKHLLDFNFKLSQYRRMSEDDIQHDFASVYFEDPMIATKFIFFVGDVRGGLGERKIFNACMSWLVDNKPEVAIHVLELIPEYTRWDNLIKLLMLTNNSHVHSNIINIIGNQLVSDIVNMNEDKSVSLCAKWMPSVNASSNKTRSLANMICKELNLTPRKYRKMLSALRSYLDVVEVKMSSNKWDDIMYPTVPSQANLKYSDAFLKHDRERRISYLEALSKGKTKINASTLQPHEVVRKYHIDRWMGTPELDTTLEEAWKALPNIQISDTLVVRDGSGSMCFPIDNNRTSCLDVATALTVYCSEHNSEAWKDKFITFSSSPKFVDLSNCDTLRDKLVRCSVEDDYSNTNIEATMRLVLNTAIENNFTQAEMPSNILIISDMQFDPYSKYYKFNWDETLFEAISKEYAEHGYKLPKMCFWNVAGRESSTIPMQFNELGLVLCSGFSTTNMKMFMSSEINPYKILLEQINNHRYDAVEEAIKYII